jgi:hypothetical protein
MKGTLITAFMIVVFSAVGIAQKQDNQKDKELIKEVIQNAYVAGTAAVAKIDFYEGAELKFIDYLTLLKFANGWKIVSKIYYPVPKEESGNPG